MQELVGEARATRVTAKLDYGRGKRREEVEEKRET
jgi:hypothetical protein